MTRARLLLATAVACFLAGGWLFSWTQAVPLSTGLYWAVETATTVGYGDVVPANPAGRLIALVVMLSTIPLLAACFALVTGHHLGKWWHEHHGKAMSLELAEIRLLAEKAHRISADTHREVTGRDHPDAPGGAP